MCGNENNPENNELFTWCVDLCMFLRRDGLNSFCSKRERNRLREIFRDFKVMSKKGFGAYETSTLRTQKWHLLVHSVDTIRDVEGFGICYGGLYETERN